MSRLSVDLETRYSLWGAIPAIYATYPDELEQRLLAQLSAASGTDLERIQDQLDAHRVANGSLNGNSNGNGNGNGNGSNHFFQALVSAFDSVLAPIHSAIEDLDLYLDPRTCPSDFLPWLAGWLGLALNERWPLTRRREFVARAVEIYKLRGTVNGVSQAVELYTGVTPEVEDNGGTAWSLEPMSPLPGRPVPRVVVRVPANPGGPAIDAELVRGVVESVKPAHVAVEVRMG